MSGYSKRDGRMILAALPGLGPVSIRKLDGDLDGGAESLLAMDASQRRSWCHPNVCKELAQKDQYLPLEAVRSAMAAMPADFVMDGDPDYPELLRPYPDRPIGLYRYCQGAQLGERRLAIVGTRRPTSYGRKQARLFAAGLVEAGFTIVSGMAEGIDTEAHRAALAAGGKTAAFLGCGLKRCYPSSNRLLMEEIATSAGVWSEFPLWRNADRRSFPQRNRIVSGVSEGVLVVESGATGGSLITARMAAEQGKPVYVIPGRVDSPESVGCHALLRDGAQAVTCVSDIIEDLSASPTWFPCTSEHLEPLFEMPNLDGDALRVWQFLKDQPTAALHDIGETLQLSAATIGATLIELEVQGCVSKRLDGRYEIS